SSTIEVDDFATQRHPDDLTVCERCAFESDSDTRGAPRSQFVRETWPGVRLVHDVGNLLTARGDVCGRRRVPAEADDDIDIVLADVRARLRDRLAEATRECEGCAIRATRERDLIDDQQLVSARGHESCFQPF